jgi:hypothetical protein
VAWLYDDYDGDDDDDNDDNDNDDDDNININLVRKWLTTFVQTVLNSVYIHN